MLTVSDGWLRVPSKRWFQAATIIDQIFNGFHGDKELSKEPMIFSKVTDLAYQEIENQINYDSSEKPIPREAVFHQVKSRSFFRLRHLQYLRKQEELNKKIDRQKQKQEALNKKKLVLSGKGTKEQQHFLAKINKFLPVPMYPQQY